ncbi:hypothetical protein HKBW3S34_01595, partial [Candidatus Hakubella thermalkaliphila]
MRALLLRLNEKKPDESRQQGDVEASPDSRGNRDKLYELARHDDVEVYL